ncbi:MAG: VTT domain-containing protein, partial [Chloroflexota bacterium]|nr:VTT domain-containing protein [Chloroflexota bacterium]
PLVSIGVSVAQIIPLPIPAPAIPLANGWLFGIWGGTLVTWVGVVLNGILGYLLARGPGRRLLMRFVSGRHLYRAEQALVQHGALAVIIARMFPVLPFSVISVAAGLLHMRWRDYLFATALGVLPSAFALALIGWQLSRGDLDWVQVGIGIGILAVLGLAAIPLTRWFRDR